MRLSWGLVINLLFPGLLGNLIFTGSQGGFVKGFYSCFVNTIILLHMGVKRELIAWKQYIRGVPICVFNTGRL